MSWPAAVSVTLDLGYCRCHRTSYLSLKTPKACFLTEQIQNANANANANTNTNTHTNTNTNTNTDDLKPGSYRQWAFFHDRGRTRQY